MTFLELYGAKLDRELGGTTDRSQRFTTALRKDAVNEGVAKFSEHTGCYTKRAPIALVDDTAEYDLEDAGVLAAGDFLWPADTGASIEIVSGSTVTYIEGDGLRMRSEEALNHTHPGWRAWDPGTPIFVYPRKAGASTLVGLAPAPDIPGSDTWTLLLPYVAKPPVLSADADVPYEGRVALMPYHDGILAYAAAQLEKLRKNYEGVQRQMAVFAGQVAKYKADQQSPRGGSIRLLRDYRRARCEMAVPFGR